MQSGWAPRPAPPAQLARRLRGSDTPVSRGGLASALRLSPPAPPGSWLCPRGFCTQWLSPSAHLMLNQHTRHQDSEPGPPGWLFPPRWTGPEGLGEGLSAEPQGHWDICVMEKHINHAGHCFQVHLTCQ